MKMSKNAQKPYHLVFVFLPTVSSISESSIPKIGVYFSIYERRFPCNKKYCKRTIGNKNFYSICVCSSIIIGVCVIRHYFALATSPGEQFNYFVSLAAWLLRKCGRKIDQPQEVFNTPVLY